MAICAEGREEPLDLGAILGLKRMRWAALAPKEVAFRGKELEMLEKEVKKDELKGLAVAAMCDRKKRFCLDADRAGCRVAVGGGSP